MRGNRTRRAAVVAAADIVAESGVVAVGELAIAERAGISLRCVRAAFPEAGSWLLAAFDEGLARLRRALTDSAPPDGTMRIERIDRGLAKLIAFVEEEPGWARLLLAEPPPSASSRCANSLERLVALLSSPAFGGAVDDRPPPSEDVRRAMLATLSLIRAELLCGGSIATDLHTSVMREAIEPVFGAVPGASMPAAASAGPRSRRRAAREAHALSAIARRPGLSNHDVCVALGLRSPRDVASLLRRLEASQLIVNVAPAPRPGKPNAWRLADGPGARAGGRRAGRVGERTAPSREVPVGGAS